MQRLGIGTVLANAFRVLFRNFGIALAIAVLTGGLGALLAHLVVQGVTDVVQVGPNDRQKLLIVTQLTALGVLTVWGAIVGAWAAAAGLYLWVQHEKGQPTSLYDAVNFGLNRFGRVVGPHAKAYLIIQLGMIILVPGILFGLQYAFVDAIATLDSQEKNPLARSRKLTAGRRGTLFRTFAVFLVWWAPYQLLLTYQAQNMGIPAIVLAGTVDHLVLLAVELCMVQYYLALFRKPAVEPEASTVKS